MSRPLLLILLAGFAVALVFGYSAVIPGDNKPRPVPTNTAVAGTTSDDDPAGAIEAGRAIYDGQCAACHTIDGSDSVGPTWQGLLDGEVTLSDGTTVSVDAAYIAESIWEPAAKIHDGYQPIMPEFDLSDAEVDSLIAFMESLE